jgi:hypothetical protein
MKNILLTLALILMSATQDVWAHDGEDHDESDRLIIAPDDQRSTWQLIQEQVLDHHCISCHHAGSSFARQSDLVLTADVAYEQLVGVVAHNKAAAADGLVRISAAGSFTAIEQSYLWEKINAPEQVHFYQDHPQYGALMPLGQQPLINGELAFIRAWIEAGAPQQGSAVDPALLADTSRYESIEFSPLEPPENGIQLHLGPFEVWSEIDREFLYFQPHVTPKDLYISGYEISMRDGSHHFLVKNYPADVPAPAPDVFRDYRDRQGNTDLLTIIESNVLQNFLFGTQTPYANFRFPPGIALRLPAGNGFDLNSHYVRAPQDQEVVGEVYANIYTVERDAVEHVAEQASFSNFEIELPPNKVTTLTRTFRFRETRQIIQMWSHAHEKMVEFAIEIVGGEHDGELLYQTNDWQHPPLLQFDPPLTMRQGEGWKLITTYNNWTDETTYFGLLSTDEMQFAFYIYYEDRATEIAEENPVLPQTTQLAQNFPNPFNNGTTIPFSLASTSTVELTIYNLSGQKVATLAQDTWNAGTHQIVWDGRDDGGNEVAGGVYLYRLRAEGRLESRKLLLLR